MKQELFNLFHEKNFTAAADYTANDNAENIAALLGELSTAHEEFLVPFCRLIDSELLADALVVLDKTV